MATIESMSSNAVAGDSGMVRLAWLKVCEGIGEVLFARYKVQGGAIGRDGLLGEKTT
jgi:hypothetical protein